MGKDRIRRLLLLFIYVGFVLFPCLFGLFVPLAVKYALECPCVPVAKNTCYVREHVSICMILPLEDRTLLALYYYI